MALVAPMLWIAPGGKGNKAFKKNGMYKENQGNLLGTFSKHIIFCLCFSLTQFLLCPKMSYVYILIY